MSSAIQADDAHSLSSSSLPPYLTPKGRDLRLDVLRGYCVFAMIVDHVALFSPLYLLTGGNRFFISAAEGFILISGITVGIVYRPFISRFGFAAAVRKALRRAFDLYLLAVGLTFVIALPIELLGLYDARGLDFSQPLDFVVRVLTLQQSYGYADVILLYVWLLMLMPIGLLLLARGHAWILLTGSVLLWLSYQFFPTLAVIPWLTAANQWFVFPAWQLLFFGALAFSFQRGQLPSLTERSRRNLHVLTGIGAAVLCGFFVLMSLVSDELSPQVQRLVPLSDAQVNWIKQYLFDKHEVRPGRIVAVPMISAFLFLSLTRWWRVLGRPLKALLLPFGQNALYAYTLHAFFIVATMKVIATFGLPMYNPWLNAAFQAIAVITIWLLARRRLLVPTPRTKRYWQAVPFALAVLVLVILA